MAAIDVIRSIRGKNGGKTPSAERAAKALEEKAAAEKAGREAELDEATQAAIDEALAMLQVGFLVAAADGELDESEEHNLAMNFGHWMGADVPPDIWEKTIQGLGAALESDGFEGCLQAAASHISDEGARGAFAFACMIGAVSNDVSDEELGLLSDVAAALGLPEEEAQTMFGDISSQVAEMRDQP